MRAGFIGHKRAMDLGARLVPTQPAEEARCRRIGARTYSDSGRLCPTADRESRRGTIQSI
jgi:hypothetical protein